MPDCCTPAGYRKLFSERSAEAQAKRYRRRGLDPTTKRVYDVLVARGVEGRTVLEVGGGIGALQIELLKAGAARAISVELTPTYEQAAAGLLEEAGLTDRVERRLLDFTEVGDGVPAADLVVLNRVLCCYHDMPRLAGAAAAHTAGLLVLSFPRGSWWARVIAAAANVGMRVMRVGFRIFVHSPRRILQVGADHGLRTLSDDVGVFWEIAALERTA